MSGNFDFLNMSFFTKASVYPGSIGTFRYRFQRTGWMGDGSIQGWVYENISFELAQDVETETFPWTEEGVELTIRGTLPPRSWSHLLCNERFGCLTGESGLGFLWYKNARECPLTPWGGDVLAV